MCVCACECAFLPKLAHTVALFKSVLYEKFYRSKKQTGRPDFNPRRWWFTYYFA